MRNIDKFIQVKISRYSGGWTFHSFKLSHPILNDMQNIILCSSYENFRKFLKIQFQTGAEYISSEESFKNWKYRYELL